METALPNAICFKCDLSFANAAMHDKLMHNGDKEFRCTFCARLFESFDALFDHLGDHNGSVCCFVCKQSFSEHEQLLFDHIDIHRELHLYGCKHCQWTTAVYYNYLKHRCNKTLIQEYQDCSSEGDYEVKSCVKEEVPNEEPLSLDGLSFERKDPTKLQLSTPYLRNDGLYYCYECPKRLRTPRGFKRHTMKHLNLMKFVCDVCGSKFPVNNKLVDHKKIHEQSSSVYHCEKCGKSYLTKNSLQTHCIRAHSGSYTCVHCSKKFTNSKRFIKHIAEKKCE